MGIKDGMTSGIEAGPGKGGEPTSSEDEEPGSDIGEGRPSDHHYPFKKRFIVAPGLGALADLQGQRVVRLGLERATIAAGRATAPDAGRAISQRLLATETQLPPDSAQDTGEALR